jgi:hypothetical protein
VANKEAKGNGSMSQKLTRSYSVSCRNPYKVAGLFSANEIKTNGLFVFGHFLSLPFWLLRKCLKDEEREF